MLGFASACYSLDKRPLFRYGVFSSLRPIQLANGFRVVISRLDYILVAPSIVSIFLQARIELSVERLKKRQVRLIEEWGEGVSGDRKSNQRVSSPGDKEQEDVRDAGSAQ